MLIQQGREVLISRVNDFDPYSNLLPVKLVENTALSAHLHDLVKPFASDLEQRALRLEDMIERPRADEARFSPSSEVEQQILAAPEFQALYGKHMHTVTHGVRGRSMHYDRGTHSTFVAALVRDLAENVFSDATGGFGGLHQRWLINDLVLAALVHDVGHGPFSHGLETAAASFDAYSHYNHEVMGTTVLYSDFSEILGSRLDSVANLLHPEYVSSDNPTHSLYQSLGYFIKDIDRLAYLLQDVSGTAFRPEYKAALAQTARSFIKSLNWHYDEQSNAMIIQSDPVAALSLLEMRYHLFREYSCHPVAQTANALIRDGMQLLARERGASFDIAAFQKMGDLEALDPRSGFPKHIARTLLSARGVEHEFDCCFSAPFSLFPGSAMLMHARTPVSVATAHSLVRLPRADMSSIEAAIRSRILQHTQDRGLDLVAGRLEPHDILVLLTPDYSKVVTSSVVKAGANHKFTCMVDVPPEHTHLNIVVKKNRGESQPAAIRQAIRTATLEALENDINVDTSRAVSENCNVPLETLNLRYRGNIDSSMF